MWKRIDFKAWLFKIVFILRIRFNLSVISYFVKLKMLSHGVKIGKRLKFNGFPIINRAPGSQITIGDNCTFHSSKHSILIGLSRPCAFVTLKKGAEIKIGNNTGASGVAIAAAGSVVIGNNVLIGACCTIIDNDFINPDPTKRKSGKIISQSVVIEDNVFLGFSCCVLKGVTIGKNSIIGAHSVILTSIPPNSVAMGNPCKVIIKRYWD